MKKAKKARGTRGARHAREASRRRARAVKAPARAAARKAVSTAVRRATEVKIRNIMRKDFFYLDGEERLDVVIEKFAKYGIHEAPVLSKGVLKGLLSDREIADAMLAKSIVPWGESKLVPMERLRKMKASQIMRKGVLTLEPGMGLADAIKDMRKRETNVIPVVDEGKVVGIVTGKDVVSYVAKNIICHDFGEACWGGGMESTVDAVLEIVNRGKPVSSMEAARELGMNTEKVEEIARSLARHGLIEIRYTIAGKMELRVLG